MQDQWVREGKGFMLVYAVNESSTFEEMSRYREKIVRIKGKNAPMYGDFIKFVD